MKNKFIILSLIEGQWYAGYEDEEFIFDGDANKAVQFETYQEAENILEDLPDGIYQIDKIFITDLSKSKIK
jgi:hypothetical protein